VAIRKYSPEWIDLEVHTKWLGLVVISDPPYPGWRVWVDGREKSMLAVDYVLRGVVVESGRHQVRWIYHPTSVKFGLFVSLLMVGVLVGIFTMTRPSTFRRLKSPKVV
jgi:uncharacterized membrane protein YfhO